MLELEGHPQTGEEGGLRDELIHLSRQALASGVDPQSPDRFDIRGGTQPLVDMAFLAQALIRSPRVLWGGLDEATQAGLIRKFMQAREILPYFNNWLLFSAMVETALFKFGTSWEWDAVRIDYALRQHDSWYVGDGTYSDGPSYHWDYYNGYVIQPMLIDILEEVGPERSQWAQLATNVRARAARYAGIQLRLISPEGTYPPIGRSLAYRFGAFHALAQSALRQELPDGVSPGEVRTALTTVLERQVEVPGTFDEDGWLTIGFAGRQPSIGERYITTGSLYLCATVLLPLGLPASADFWQDEAMDWIGGRVWRGVDEPPDRALD